MPVHDYIISFVLLLALAAVAARRKDLIEGGLESYRNISTGLVILNFASLLRIFYEQSMLVNIPFVSESLFFRLVYWTLIITGATLLVSGVSSWLPIARKNRQYSSKRIQRLELLKEVRQLIRVESRIPVVLEKTLCHMVSDYKLLRGSVYTVSQSGGEARLVGSFSSAGETDESLRGISLNDSVIREITTNGSTTRKNLMSSIDGDLTPPDDIIPVLVGTKLAALFLLWSNEGNRLRDDDRTLLKLAADMVADELDREKVRAHLDLVKRLEQWRVQMTASLAATDDIKTALPVIAEGVRNFFEVDLLQLSIMFGDGSTERHTVGENLALLSEKSIALRNEAELMDRLASEQPYAIFELASHPEIEDLQILRSGDVQQLIAIAAHGSGASPRGLLLMGAGKTLRVNAEQRASVDILSRVLTEMLSREEIVHRAALENARSAKIERLLLAADSDMPTGELFSQISAVACRELKADAVRIVTRDLEEGFAVSNTLCVSRPTQATMPADGSIILSLTPGLASVLESGRSVVIDQEDPERSISDFEASLLFGTDLPLGLIVPVLVRSRAAGALVVSGISRKSLADDSLRFVESLAIALGLRLRTEGFGEEPGESDVRHRKVTLTNSELRNQIRSSVAGIAGSVEYIREKNRTNITDNMEKCLSIIDRSVKRLTDYVTS